MKTLHAFEVATGMRSDVLAGAELDVTAAAVNLQVRHLEEHLGKQLFLRQGNRITLTDARRAAYPRLWQALSDLAALSAELLDQPRRAKLILSALPSLPELWLLPRLQGFAGLAPLKIRVEDDPVLPNRSGMDLRLDYGGYADAKHETATLCRDRIVPVAKPGLFDALPALPAAAFIHTDWGLSFVRRPSWRVWSLQGAATAPDFDTGLRVGSSAMAVAAARAGLGVALVPECMTQIAVEVGRLRVLPSGALPRPSDFMLVFPRGLARRPSLRALMDHLVGQ